MGIDGFKELLEGIKKRIDRGDFKKTFDNSNVSEGDPARFLNEHPVDIELAKKMMSELPQELFQAPLLDTEALWDDMNPNHGQAQARLEECKRLLESYLDKITQEISLVLLDEDSSELNRPTQEGLVTNYDTLLKKN